MLLEPSAQSVFGTIPRVNHAGAAVIWFWAYRCCLPSLPIVICLPGPGRAPADYDLRLAFGFCRIVV